MQWQLCTSSLISTQLKNCLEPSLIFRRLFCFLMSKLKLLQLFLKRNNSLASHLSCRTFILFTVLFQASKLPEVPVLSSPPLAAADPAKPAGKSAKKRSNSKVSRFCIEILQLLHRQWQLFKSFESRYNSTIFLTM